MDDKVTEVVLNDSVDYIAANIKQQQHAIESGKGCSVILISGAPGIGKSDLMTQVAEKLHMGLNPQYLGTMLLEQFGMPLPMLESPAKVDKSQFQRWSLPEFYSVENLRVKPNPICKEDNWIILFMDDIHLATKTIQTYFFQLLTYRSIHNKKMPNNFVMVAAGNRALDRAGAQPIMAPIVNRFFILDVRAEAKDWINNFALSYGIRHDIVSFIELYPEMIQSEPLESKPWASPRSWTYFSDALNEMELVKKLDIGEYLNLGKGHIGLEYASKFSEYIQLFTKWDSKSFLSGQIPLPDFKTLSKIENYTFMSSLIAELLKDLRSEKSDKLRPESEIKLAIVKVMFNQLVDSCKEIIPLGLRTLVCNKSSIYGGNTLIYYKLIDNNPVLLEVAKKLLSVKTK
jgi:hypothetical protein